MTGNDGATKGRYRSKLERRQIAQESLQPGVSAAKVAKAHGVRTNQVFQWRKLYREGRLGVATERLLPVRIEPGERSSGTIRIELGKVRIQMEGAVDPESLRIILEHVAR